MADFPDEFTAQLLSLNHLLVDEETLDNALQRVAHLACKASIGADTAGVTLQRDDGPTTAAFYGDAALQLDRAQYAADDGPCLTSVRTGETIRVDVIATESSRWPAYAARAAALDIRSSLALPLTVRGSTLGALNLYSTTDAAFTDQNVELARAYARQAAVALANAEVYWRTYALTQNLEAALESRDKIGQAKGILMAAHHLTEDGAFDLLRHASQHLNLRLRDVADHVVRTGDLPTVDS